MIAATRFGKPLPDGGTIGVAAAASPYDSRSDVLRGVEWWEARGYTVTLADGVWDRDDYVAGHARRRGEDLNALFADPEVDVVQALQGGFGSAQAIPYLDFDLIAANPKPLVGYSDITALHVAIRQRAGVATVYGNGLMGVGAVETTAFTKDRLLDVLRTGGAGEVPHDPDDPWVRTLNGGRVTAPLVGGCLWLLMQTMGTHGDGARRRDPLLRGHAHAAVLPRRSPGQLAHAGKLEQVAGVVVGQLEKSDYGDLRPVSDWARSRTIEDVLEERLGSLGVPAIYGLPLGTRSTSRRSRSADVHARRRREDAHGRRAGSSLVGGSSSWWTKRPRTTPMICARTGGPGGPAGCDHAYANSAPNSRIHATT